MVSRFLVNISLKVTVFLVVSSKACSPYKTTLNTGSSFYACHVVFDERLKDTGHGSRIIVSKYPKISYCH